MAGALGIIPATMVLETIGLLISLCSYGWRYRLRSYVLRVKAECTTIVLSANELLVFPSRQRYAVCLFEVHRNSLFRASCFRWRDKSVAASVLSNRTGKPLPCHKLSAIHVHRRIVATTSCGKYLSRLFIALPFNHSSLTSRKVTYLYLP